ncbi:nickel-binding protein [Arenimonas soli]|nr:nickel-binding protein [Arenimonas soli]
MLKRYVIERSIPGVGTLPAEAMSGVAANARLALEALGPGARWLQSFVTHDKTYCIYLARGDGAHSAR